MEKSRIKSYLHCKTCLDMKTMTDKAKLAVGWTDEGLQVFCETCDQSVIDLDFEGKKVKLMEA